MRKSTTAYYLKLKSNGEIVYVFEQFNDNILISRYDNGVAVEYPIYFDCHRNLFNLPNAFSVEISRKFWKELIEFGFRPVSCEETAVLDLKSKS